MLALVMVLLFLGLPAYVIVLFVRHANPSLPHPVVSGAPVHTAPENPVPGVAGVVLGAYLDSAPGTGAQYATPATVVEALTVEAVRPFDHAGGPVYVHPSLTRMFAQQDAVAGHVHTRAAELVDEAITRMDEISAQAAEAAQAIIAQPAAPVSKPAAHKTATKQAQQDTRERVAAERKTRNRRIAEVMRAHDVAVTDATWPIWCEVARTFTWDVAGDTSELVELFGHAFTSVWQDKGSAYVRVAFGGRVFGDEHLTIEQAHDILEDAGNRTRDGVRKARKAVGLTVRGTAPRPTCEGTVAAGHACTRKARMSSRFCCDTHAENYARS